MKNNKILLSIRKVGLKRVLRIIVEKYISVHYYFLKYQFFFIKSEYLNYESVYVKIPDDYKCEHDLIEKNEETISNLIDNEFRMFGVTFFNNELACNKDFKTMQTWENKFYKRIVLKSFTNDRDPKFPLEFSRLNHLLILSLIYNIDKSKISFNNIISQIKRWDNDNYVGNGMSWACTMDVALRAVNIVSIYGILSNDVKFGNYERKLFNKIIYTHGVFICDNLENKNLHKNNHYLSNLLGLLFVGTYYKDLDFGSKMLNFAKKELEKEMTNQTNSDGTNYEGSTYYHKFVFELFFYANILMKHNEMRFSDEYEYRLYKQYEFLKAILKPGDELPLIGDCDNGYVLNINNYFAKNARCSCQVVHSYESFMVRAGYSMKIEEPKGNQYLMNSFNDGGLYLIKNSKMYLLIKCGSVGTKGMGGHSHNDQLSFELNIAGKDFIVDPGTATYYGNFNLRNDNRKTISHNTLFYKKYEQNDFNERDIFILKEQTFAKCTNFANLSFSGEHYGFYYKNGNIHKRDITIENDCISILDRINNLVDSPCISFNLHPEVKISEQENGVILSNGDIKIIIELENYRIYESVYCYGYGDYVKTNRIITDVIDLEMSTRIKII